jgi:hypothetical protein
MSTKYTGGFITKSPVAPTSSAASGIWTLDQQQQAQKAGTWPSPPIFIEDIFSTYLYTGNGTTQTITNDIDLSNKGGLVWIKDRTISSDQMFYDTARGAGAYLRSNTTSAQSTSTSYQNFTAFTSSGFSLGASSQPEDQINKSGDAFASWTFRKQPKFFDVVTYTGNGSTGGQTINHNLGSTPGCIIVKQTDGTNAWRVYHQSLGVSAYLALNTTAASATDANNPWKTPTSTTFGVGDGVYWTSLNQSGSTYVAYLFAHDAGGFPVSGGGSTNGISCGSYVGTGSPLTVNLGYEPQWVLIKRATGGTNNWVLMDIARGLTPTTALQLFPNVSDPESDAGGQCFPTATGFEIISSGTNLNAGGATYIYIAIRRGPMKTPTVGTSVYGAETWSGNGSSPRTFTSSNWTFPADLVTVKATDSAAYWNVWGTRLTGGGTLSTNSTGAELSAAGSVAGYVSSFNQTGYTAITGTSSISNYNNSSAAYVSYNIRRAPGFFDVVCYTGTGSTQAITHNLGVTPELIIIKNRTGVYDWLVYSATTGTLNTLFMNLTNAVTAYTVVSSPAATAFVANGVANSNTDTFVAYLFATVSGVSKVGSYTGTGALQTVNCGFTSGARFVMIKRTDSTGGWFYYDSVRGITSGNDPYLFFNVSDAQVTGTNYVDTDTTGFKVTAAAPAAINANGGTYLFLAIA